ADSIVNLLSLSDVEKLARKRSEAEGKYDRLLQATRISQSSSFDSPSLLSAAAERDQTDYEYQLAKDKLVSTTRTTSVVRPLTLIETKIYRDDHLKNNVPVYQLN